MSADVRLGFRLGPWKIEPPIGTVTGPDGDTTHLEPKVMDVLTCLARHPNELVSREQLLDSVWNGQSASDELLTRAISGLRHALHDARSDPKYIETIPKRGYRLLGDIQTVDRLDFESSGDDEKLASAYAKRNWPYAGAGLVALTLAIFVFDQYLPDATWSPSSSSEESSVKVGNTTPPATLENSIAVLPFKNLSSDPEQGYLVDGIHGEVITSLASVGALSVISRSSVMLYRGQNKPPQVIANELNVKWIVDATVTRAGNEIRVNIELIDAPSGEHVWGKGYTEDLEDAFALQIDLARAIVDQLRIELTPLEYSDPSGIGRVAPDPDAYVAYLKGSQILNEGLGAKTLRGVNFFEQSIEADPTFAPAYAALARELIYDLAFIKDGPERQEWITRAGIAAQKALQLDSSLVEAHVALAGVEGYLWNWDAAINAYERALDLTGDLSIVHSAYGAFLARLGHLDEALKQMKEAQRIAPLSPGVYQGLGWIYYWRADYDEAIEQFNLALAIDPTHGIARNNLKWVYASAGMVEQLLADDTKDRDCYDLEKLAFAYAVRGQHTLAENTYRSSLELCPLGEDAGALEASTYYFILRDEGKALELLRRSYNRQDEEFVLETRFPWWDPVRAHPEFMELMKKSGLDKAARPFPENRSHTNSN